MKYLRMLFGIAKPENIDSSSHLENEKESDFQAEWIQNPSIPAYLNAICQ